MTDSEGVTDEPGDLGSNASIFRPSSFGLRKESSFSELQWLVDSMILETDKVNLSLSQLRKLSTCLRVWILPCGLLPSLWADPHSNPCSVYAPS